MQNAGLRGGILRGSGAVLAVGAEGLRSTAEMVWAAGAIAHRVKADPEVNPPWLLACEDPFVFLAGLLGILSAKGRVVIPPNLLPETLEHFSAQCAGTVRGNGLLPGSLGSDDRTDRSPTLSRIPQGGGGSSSGADLDLGAMASGSIDFWTSGSSGEPKRVPRRFGELLDEVEVLEGLFGARLGPGPILGTVPHQHIYGFLFRLLWPLATGRPFVTEACGTPGSLKEALRRIQPAALVSCPAHLSRFPHLLGFGTELQPPPVVFSSGGALAPEDARLWPSEVYEVFGSTETGGVAWRMAEGESPWTAFPDVRLDQAPDGALLLDSRRLPAGPHRMEDAAEFLPDGRFFLKGRLDRVVKVQEKRVSLPEVEEALATHPWVQCASAVLLTEPRQMLGAALVLDPAAPPVSPHELHLALRAHLSGRFEAAALPRRWRVVEALPLNASGKVAAARVRDLFESQPR